MNPDRPDRTEWLLRAAELAAERSTCSRAHVGAVIARAGRILVTGYNGAPAGMPHCNHQVYATIVPDSGGQLRTDRGCQQAVHAEANTIAFAARHGVGTDGCDLYCTHAPCLECARLILNAGISRVVFRHTYRDSRGIQLLEQAGMPLLRCP